MLNLVNIIQEKNDQQICKSNSFNVHNQKEMRPLRCVSEAEAAIMSAQKKVSVSLTLYRRVKGKNYQKMFQNKKLVKWIIIKTKIL